MLESLLSTKLLNESGQLLGGNSMTYRLVKIVFDNHVLMLVKATFAGSSWTANTFWNL